MGSIICTQYYVLHGGLHGFPGVFEVVVDTHIYDAESGVNSGFLYAYGVGALGYSIRYSGTHPVHSGTDNDDVN